MTTTEARSILQAFHDYHSLASEAFDAKYLPRLVEEAATYWADHGFFSLKSRADDELGLYLTERVHEALVAMLLVEVEAE